MADNEFKFSLISEKEIRMNEEGLRVKVDQTLVEVEKQKAKLRQLRDMVMPLLEGLSQEPDKTYILWEDRSPKISALIERINNLVDG